MGEKTGIAWCDHTFNPWWGCAKVSPGCENCYAEREASRFWSNLWGPNSRRRFFGDKHWLEPILWNKKAKAEGVRRKVFCGSMCDVFEERSDVEKHREELFSLMWLTPHLDWLLLTKRPENIAGMLPKDWDRGYPNVWLGTTVETQAMADERLLLLLKNPAVVRFVSVEPMLAPIYLDRIKIPYGRGRVCDYLDALTGEIISHVSGCVRNELNSWIDWVIVGGESGPGARPMHPDWVRALRDQCKGADVPFFFKQWGEWLPDDQADPRNRRDPMFETDMTWARVGKKKAGDLLDGIEYKEFPEMSSGK